MTKLNVGLLPKGLSSDKIEWIKVVDLAGWAKNPRTHSLKQIRQIASSMERFGFITPVLVDEKNVILAGHGRVEAAKLLKMESVPCARINALTTAEKRAFVLADNKIAMNAGWDEDLLARELRELANEEFDVSITGFSISEVDTLLDLDAEEQEPDEEQVPFAAPARCKPGEIWQLGRHRLVCGNSLQRETVTALMDSKRASMVFTDPPYNVRIQGHAGGKGKIKHAEFAMASGELSSAKFSEFLSNIISNLIEFSIDGSIHFLAMDWRHMKELLAAADKRYAELKNLIMWDKGVAGMGSFYRSRHELIFVFKNGTAPHHNSFELGQHGRNRSNVWQYRGMAGFSKDRAADLQRHPTAKPVQLVADAIRDVTPRGAIVLDLFGGGGSTLIASHKVGRRAFLAEIDPTYCDCILHRWEVFAGDEATCVGRIASA